MTSELKTPDPDGSNGKVTTQPTKITRELAWRIAPSLLISFKYAWAGISYAFHTQRNFRIHVILGGLAIGVGAFLHLSAVEMSVVGLTIGAVLAMELLNTAIESVVDLTVKQNYHELAKIAKDCAAAAVLISALAAIGVAGSLVLPRLFIKLWQISQTSVFLH
ncbi:diacylglycerol kinase family protein [Leptolyngbyaceae cyanobacterium UHCC 1019]